MSKKVYALVSACVNAAGITATAIMTYCQPDWAVAIVSGIGIVATAINEVCAGFIETEKKEE